MYNIIPDIHGQAEKLKGALTNLGYAYRNGAWRHAEPNRTCVFLGDCVDRGESNAEVIDIVRRMMEAGTAQAIMGNHELNAIHFYTLHPDTGLPLRKRTKKNGGQHKTFLDEFPMGAAKTNEQISWMKELPLFLDLGQFRGGRRNSDQLAAILRWIRVSLRLSIVRSRECAQSLLVPQP